jgi:hypothetical protein
MKEHTAICSECKKEFVLESAKFCDHFVNLWIGSLLCPHCNTCICHGETVDQIENRFRNNVKVGKFIKVDPNKTPFNWKYMCKTVKEIEI